MKKHKYLFCAVSGILTVVIIILAIFGFRYFTRVGYKSTGEHPIANSLRENVSCVPYFKDGNIYYYKDGKSILAAEKVYDASSKNPVFTADYAIDSITEKMLYVSDSDLYLFDGKKTEKIGNGVTSWRTSKGLENVAFTTKWQKNNELGALFLYKNGQIIVLDTGITPAFVRFSQDGSCLFAEKPNTYPKVRSQLYKYSLDGTKELLFDSTYPVFWVNNDGSQVVTGENNDDGLYSYRIFSKNFKKQLELFNVYLTEVTDDQSILYALTDYDIDKRKGTLWAIDLYSLKMQEISKDASFFNASAVTDASKGIVYSVLTDEHNDYFSIFYGDVSGKSTRLIRNTTEESLYSVAINSEKKSGFILTYGATKQDGGVYYIKWKGTNLETVPIMAGYVDSLVYYELTDSVSFVKNPNENYIGQLYFANSLCECSLVSENCGVTYDSSNQVYQSACVFSNKTDSVMYFTDITLGKTTVDTSGTLNIKTPSETKVISENVSSAYMEAPIANGTLEKIYYLKETDSLFDLYLYENGENLLIDTNVHGIIELK